MTAEQTAWCPCTCHNPHQHDQTGDIVSTDNAAEAKMHLGYANTQREDEMAHLGYAHVHATLAVAAELRVNNLLAIRRDLPIANGLRAAITTHLLGYADQTVGGAS